MMRYFLMISLCFIFLQSFTFVTAAETNLTKKTPEISISQSFWQKTWTKISAPFRRSNKTIDEVAFTLSEPIKQADTLKLSPLSFPTLPNQDVNAEVMTVPTPDDQDSFIAENDWCPSTPGTQNGCPDFRPYTVQPEQKNLTIKRINTTDYRYESFDQIRQGDRFELRIVDPLTEKTIFKSAPYLVEN